MGSGLIFPSLASHQIRKLVRACNRNETRPRFPPFPHRFPIPFPHQQESYVYTPYSYDSNAGSSGTLYPMTSDTVYASSNRSDREPETTTYAYAWYVPLRQACMNPRAGVV
jgi:hypothetical protein